MLRGRRLPASLGLAVAITVTAAAPASATWSIVGVDPVTGKVGVAVASCVPAEVNVVPVIVPGKGAAASQSAINGASGDLIVTELTAGTSPAEIIAKLKAADSASDTRQYGIVALGGAADGFSGAKNSAVSLDRRNSSNTASAQGNILVGPKVVEDAIAAYDATQGSLEAKLLAALKAGSLAGGDSRCGAQTASAAALLVSSGKDGEPDQPWAHTAEQFPGVDVDSVPVPTTYISILKRKGQENAVDELVSRYQREIAASTNRIKVSDVDQLARAMILPGWLLAVLGLGALSVLGLIIWLIVRVVRRRGSKTA